MVDRASPVPPVKPPAARKRVDRPRLRAAGFAARRALAALAASAAAPLVAGAISGFLRAPLDRRGGALREAALFLPLAAPLAMVMIPLALLASRARVDAVLERMHRDETTARRTAASLLVGPAAIALWIALLARVDRFFLTAFHHVGLAALAQATALAALSLGCAGLYGAVHRAAARVVPARAARRFVPWLAVGLGLALAIVAIGMKTGDTDGRGRWFGAFGVLRKPELDLSPVYALAGLGAIAIALTVGLSRSALVGLTVLIASSGFGALAFRHVARHFSEAPSAAAVDARPGVARMMLRLLRKRTDRDHDGASGLFGGGDCNDRDRSIFPAAHDVPGNGRDEDCSGRDAPLPPPPPPPPPPTLRERLLRETPADMNVVLITVDTMRWDLHYAGNPREFSPSMDRLAAESVVFDHAYALSSYTGRAIAPLMAGRFPTECARDSEHFTQYPASNILLAERLRDAGFATFGAASHFYFHPRFGLVQGMTTWDMSSQPSDDAQESTSADAAVCDRALAQLRAHEHDTRRFFQWVHFFDPHKQYVPHPGGLSFGSGERARYDGEVAWSDRQVGRIMDALAALPFASRTIVVVTADHGEAFGEHGMGYHGVELWDELVRVPWIIRVPGIAPRHVSVPRSQIDFAPTMLELLRLPAPARTAPDAMSGVSLVPDLLGEPMPPRPIYIELPEGPYNSMRRAVIDHGWKLVERGTGRFELYDLTHDPGERTDLARTRAEELSRMRGVLESVRAGLHVVQARE